MMGFIKALMGICETKPLDPALWTVEGDKARLQVVGRAEVLPKGGGVYIQGLGLDRPLLVIRTEDDNYLAFTNRCTHIGHRKLDHLPEGRMLRCCSLFHSTFDYDGRRVSGPATEALTRHQVSVDGTELVVKL